MFKIIKDLINKILKDDKLKKQVLKFPFSGFSAVGTDFAVYYILLNAFGYSISKTISFISGTIVAYFLNKFWTFEQKKKSFYEVIRFIVLYAVTLLINVSINKMVLIILPGITIFAFLCATGTSTILNFIGQKWWVFKEIKARDDL